MPDDALAQGLAHLRAGQPARAIPLLRAALAQDAGHQPAVRALATAHLAQGDPRAARQTLRDYLVGEPMCAQGWRLAALLEWKLGRYDDAVGLVRRGLDLLPHSPVLRRQLDVFLAKSPLAAPHDASPNADYLDRIARDTKLLRALITLPAHEQDMPMLRALESRLALLLRSQPAHPDRQLLLARLQLRLGDDRAAARSVQRALRARPDYPQALRLRATLLARAGDYAQAVRTLQSLLARGLDWPDLHVQIAQWQHAQGQNERARHHLYEALRKNPRYAKARSLLQRCAA